MATTSRRRLARGIRGRNGRTAGPAGAIHGTARLGRKTKDLVKRLGAQDVAIIDHRNLDRIAAEELVAAGVRAVVNVSPSSDGSYPNVGPLTLVRAGVPLVDALDPALFDRLRDGDPLVIEGGSIRVPGGDVVAEGRAMEADELATDLDEQRRRVDGGADAILKEGMKPDVVLGDMDSAREATLRSGAELIVHGYPDGTAPGAERLRGLGLDYTVVPAAGTSQDVAMLLADEKGASLIVSVGAHFNLVEFLDKNREGMSSTFLTRLRIGETLVDAKGVSRLYAPGLSGGNLGLLLA